MSAASMPVVEALLHEFYQTATPNARKREIEAELIAFRTQPAAWQLCLGVVAASQQTNHFLWFFSTSTLEHAITRRWSLLSATDRALLRDTLWNTYASLCTSGDAVTPRRQRDTYAQLIALLGKREFPDDHPNYMLHCIELVKTKFTLGINLLRTTSEEVVSNREDVTTDRKNYFHSCFSLCIPDVMDLVTKYLLIAVCHINDKDIHSISSALMDYSLETSLPNDNQLSCSTVELLSCVQHLVSWIPTDLISEYFLMSILDLSQWRAAHAEVSLTALSVLNELLYLQKPLPYDATFMGGVNGLLEQHNTTKQQSEMYVDKFRELLRLYTTKYWPKMLHDNELLERFLKSLYCCTIFKNGALDFTEKLEIWSPIIKGLAVSAKLHRYNDIIHQLVAEIMRRTQFEYNKAELELLDNETVEDNTQTEWQQFLTQCIECVALVAESRPNAVFAQVSSHWSRPHVYLMSVEHDLDSSQGGDLVRKLIAGAGFSEHLRDFSTVCQAVVRIAPLLNADSPEVRAEVNCQLQLLMEHLLTTLAFLGSGKLKLLNVDRSTFQTDLEYLHAQLLMAIRSILPISAQLRTDSMLQRLFDAVGDIFQPTAGGVSHIVVLAASQLLLCVATVLRPKCLLEIPTVVALMQAGPKLTHLPRTVVANIHISLMSYFVLKWKNVADQQQELQRRSAMLREYVDCLAHQFMQLHTTAEVSKVATTAQTFLGTFSLVVDFFRDSSNTTKDMLVNTLKPIITKALILYDAFGLRSSAMDLAVADFSLSILRTLQTQLGAQFQCDMMRLFLSVSSREHLSPSRLVVTERILQMFQLIVQQPGNASTALLPTILDFVVELILPLLQHESKLTDSSELCGELYTLFDSILTCKWQYFYKSHIQHNGGGGTGLSGDSSGGVDNQHPEQFLSILNAYGQVLVSGSDPSVVRTVLASMQSVNERWRLYQRPLFKDKLLASFQSALINALLCGDAGALHYDLLTNALFAMGQVDTLQLRDSFAVAGFPCDAKIISDICAATDIPTFSQKLSQLIQDAHCVHLTQT